MVLRIEDHDRQRSRPEFDAALLEDLGWLGFVADIGPVRQSEDWFVYEAALARLRDRGLVYACDCTRSTFAAWARGHGRPWSGGGCPGGCRERDVAEGRGTGLRAALGPGEESWHDLRLGPRRDAADREGDLLVRDLVVRGEDLLDATARQIRLGRLLGRDRPLAFYHHPLIRKPGGAKMSKSDGDSGVRELRARGLAPDALLGEAAAAVGLIAEAQPLELGSLDALFG